MKGIDLSTMPMGGFTFPIEERKKQFERSIIRRYDNGWTLNDIDAHPDAAYFRNPENDEALPDERYIILKMGNIVVHYFKTLQEVGEFEKEMKLNIV